MKGHLLELLAFCVQQHGFRIRYYLLDNSVVTKILGLLKCNDKHLVLCTPSHSPPPPPLLRHPRPYHRSIYPFSLPLSAALRFFRAFVGVNDKYFIKHIVKENLFAPIVDLFLANQSRYNMINSAVLDLFNFIKTEGVKVLAQYFIEKFYDRVEHVTYTEVFHLMKVPLSQKLITRI